MRRKDFLRLTAVAPVASIVAGAGAGSGGGGLVPVDAVGAVLRAVRRYPLVGIGDNHMCEQGHAFLRSLVRRPVLPFRIDDIVVEFGNAFYQGIADRFFLELQPVGGAELALMWRTTIGGRVYWDAPVYERFYRTVRAVNESLPRGQRLRVILGDVPVDWSRIRGAADADLVPTGDQRETFYAGVVEREVLARHRRALLVAGGDHLRRGIRTTPGGLIPPKDPNQPSAGTLLADRHPGSLYVILPFSAVNSAIQSLPRGVPERLTRTMTPWPVPSIAALDGTWVAPQPMPDRVLDPASTISDQSDAILWEGTDDSLTCARADPALYRSGAYADELRRRGEILTEITGRPVDLVAEGLHLAGLGPSCSQR